MPKTAIEPTPENTIQRNTEDVAIVRQQLLSYSTKEITSFGDLVCRILHQSRPLTASSGRSFLSSLEVIYLPQQTDMTLHLPPQTRRFWRFNSASKIYTLRFLSSCVLISSLIIAPVALAGYKPKNPSRPSGSTGTTGVRTGSCSKATEGTPTAPAPLATKGTLTALAPLGHIGQTIATHPTFAWYVPDTESHPIEFSLYSYSNNGKPVLQHRDLLQSAKGIRRYTLPKEQAGLMAGQKYLWQVALLCNASDPSKDRIAVAEVEVVAIPALLLSSLAKTSDHLQRANLYAESGFWYDAIAEALEDDKTRLSSIALLKDLLKLEAPNSLEAAQKQSDRLKQVIELEQQ